MKSKNKFSKKQRQALAAVYRLLFSLDEKSKLKSGRHGVRAAAQEAHRVHGR